MLGADRGDLRKIWDAMHIHWHSQLLTSRGEFPDYLGRDKNFAKSCGNNEWGRLIKVVDMSQKEWDEYNGEDEEYSESEEDGESLLGDISFEAALNLEENQG